MRRAAAALGERVRAEDGVGAAVRCLQEWGLLSPPMPESLIEPLRNVG
jgi:hypothetical protein